MSPQLSYLNGQVIMKIAFNFCICRSFEFVGFIYLFLQRMPEDGGVQFKVYKINKSVPTVLLSVDTCSTYDVLHNH